jgi:hypothetical protein
MGNQETFPRTELACAVMIFSKPNSQHPTPNVALPELNSRRRELRVNCLVQMPGRGLEPLRISPPDPKSGASANFATLALLIPTATVARTSRRE